MEDVGHKNVAESLISQDKAHEMKDLLHLNRVAEGEHL